MLWEHLREVGHSSIIKVDFAKAWTYRLGQNEFSVEETFHHTVRAIYEDACNWYLKQPQKFESTGDASQDLDLAVDQMLKALSSFDDKNLEETFRFPWGVDTTIEFAIQQDLFHALGHFSQIRERAGFYSRTMESQQ
jgi:hypothetical protein